MTDRPERPVSLKRSPRPASDENVDPVDAPAPASPLPAQSIAAHGPTQPPAQSSAPPAAPAQASPAPNPIARPAQPRVALRRKREITVPFSTRLAPETMQLIDEAATQTGQTIRGVVEEAIWAHWDKSSS